MVFKRGIFGSRESGIGVGAQCLRPRESGVGSRESGVGSRESGIGSRESGVGKLSPPVPCSLFPVP
ncbi:AraC family transcriptional regulator [Spirulina subsalsa]|uniref:AraC family transcriptional regulator n=1 Tax=Spirulina subsalsa TaxID=54311 RepID=UPI001ED9B35A|nr:AraC family transcriptional regulator [Spirulina subsalsa]